MRHKMLLRKTLDYFFFHSSNTFQRNSLALKLLSKWNSKSHRKGITARGRRASAAFDAVVAKPLVCALWRAWEDSSSLVSHISGAACSRASQCHSDRAPGARHRQQMRFGISIPFMCFEEAYEKIAIKPSRSLFLLSFSALYHVSMFCNFSQLTGVQREMKQMHLCLQLPSVFCLKHK